MVPASKALEYWIIQIAKDLGIAIDSDKIGVVRGQIERNIEAILSTADGKLEESIKVDIIYLRNFIQEYRNNIVHCDNKLEEVGMAKSRVIAIYERINSVTSKLLKAGVIKQS